MENQSIIACYKFYDRKGRRLSCYSRFIDEMNIEIVTIPCSKDDKFVKRTGVAYYKDHLVGLPLPKDSLIIKVQAKPEEGTFKTLVRYAFNNLYYNRKATKTFTVNKLTPLNHA